MTDVFPFRFGFQVLKIISNGEEQNVESVQALSVWKSRVRSDLTCLRSDSVSLAIASRLLMTEFREQNDRQAYFLLGIACRLAMDLNLGQPLPHLDERRNRNRIRCWLNAYSMDRRFAGLGAAGSPSMMSEDWAVRNCTNFHRHPTASIGDARLVAAVELRTLLSRYDALLKTNAEHMQAEGQAPLFNLRDLFLAASSELDTYIPMPFRPASFSPLFPPCLELIGLLFLDLQEQLGTVVDRGDLDPQ